MPSAQSRLATRWPDGAYGVPVASPSADCSSAVTVVSATIPLVGPVRSRARRLSTRALTAPVRSTSESRRLSPASSQSSSRVS